MEVQEARELRNAIKDMTDVLGEIRDELRLTRKRFEEITTTEGPMTYGYLRTGGNGQ